MSAQRVSFTVPVTGGNYAPERITFAGFAGQPADPLLGVTVLIESAAASSAVELWLPKAVVAQPPADGDYFLFASTTTSVTWALASFPGAQVRVKSGGTAGATVVSATAD